MEEKHKKKSRLLSYMLRHRPEEFGLELGLGGWVSMSLVVATGKFTSQELHEIVSTDAKGRYSITYHNYDKMIRANQGHSAQVDMEFIPVDPPRILFHGTADKNFTDIMFQGLKRMNRQHVHLTENEETAKETGSRHGKPMIIKVRARDMYADGFEFYKSENNVWLTDRVPAKYLAFG